MVIGNLLQGGGGDIKINVREKIAREARSIFCFIFLTNFKDCSDVSTTMIVNYLCATFYVIMCLIRILECLLTAKILKGLNVPALIQGYLSLRS